MSGSEACAYTYRIFILRKTVFPTEKHNMPKLTLSDLHYLHISLYF